MFKFIQSYYNSYGAWECVKMLFALICIGVCIGQVVEGMDIIEAADSVETDSNDKPVNDLVIEKITIRTV